MCYSELQKVTSEGGVEDCHLAAPGSIPATAKSKMWYLVILYINYNTIYTLYRSEAVTQNTNIKREREHAKKRTTTNFLLKSVKNFENQP